MIDESRIAEIVRQVIGQLEEGEAVEEPQKRKKSNEMLRRFVEGDPLLRRFNQRLIQLYGVQMMRYPDETDPALVEKSDGVFDPSYPRYFGPVTTCIEIAEAHGSDHLDAVLVAFADAGVDPKLIDFRDVSFVSRYLLGEVQRACRMHVMNEVRSNVEQRLKAREENRQALKVVS